MSSSTQPIERPELRRPVPNNPDAPTRHTDEVTAALDSAMLRIRVRAEEGWSIDKDSVTEILRNVKREHQVAAKAGGTNHDQ
jgi:hypothetical protein